MTSTSTKKNPLSREAWLNLSLEVLRNEGIQGVRIERLARDLGVTKGSFYWLFKDREDLWKSLLNYWDDRFTGVVVKNRALIESGPSEGLFALIKQVLEDGLDQYEVAMRAWADHDSTVEVRVREVYSKRTDFVRSFFNRLGFRGDDAEARTRLLLSHLSWAPSMYPDEPMTNRLKLLKHQLKLLTRP